ncbi:MAG: hypothetical protein EBQ96_08905 [Proteobacteria bacterium]|nr:hypothetical protein [Pseudomonadota bacterium]
MTATSTVAAVLMTFTNATGDAPPKPHQPQPSERFVIQPRVPKVERPGPRSRKDRRNAGEHPPLPWETL